MTEAEIAQFEAHYPPGSRARLAFALLLYTGQRRSDVIRMGRQHVRVGALEIRQTKTGTALTIPVHPEFRAPALEIGFETVAARLACRSLRIPWSSQSRCSTLGGSRQIHAAIHQSGRSREGARTAMASSWPVGAPRPLLFRPNVTSGGAFDRVIWHARPEVRFLPKTLAQGVDRGSSIFTFRSPWRLSGDSDGPPRPIQRRLDNKALKS